MTRPDQTWKSWVTESREKNKKPLIASKNVKYELEISAQRYVLGHHIKFLTQINCRMMNLVRVCCTEDVDAVNPKSIGRRFPSKDCKDLVA